MKQAHDEFMLRAAERARAPPPAVPCALFSQVCRPPGQAAVSRHRHPGRRRPLHLHGQLSVALERGLVLPLPITSKMVNVQLLAGSVWPGETPLCGISYMKRRRLWRHSATFVPCDLAGGLADSLLCVSGG